MITLWRTLSPAFCIVLMLVAGCVSTTSGRVRAEPDDAAAAEQYYQLGARYFNAGNYELARDRLKLALDFDPRMAIAHSTLALTYERLDVPRLAEEHYASAVRYGPRNIDVRNTYAVFLCRQGEYEEAAEQFERVVQIPENDNEEVALTNAGVCMLQGRDLERAESFFRRALERKPGYGEALLQMTLLMRSNNDLLSSRAFLQRYLAAQPVSPQVLLLGVQIECELGDDSARSDLEDQLIREFPDSSEARRVLGPGGSCRL